MPAWESEGLSPRPGRGHRPEFRLETDRLLLREWTLEDVPRILDLYADPEVMRHIGDGLPLGPAEVERGIRATLRRYRLHGIGMWCVEEKSGDRILGHCGLQRWEGTTDVEVGFLLAREAWGHGYATEAAQAALDWGFRNLGLPRIVAVARAENERSLAVLRRIGMTSRGTTSYKGQKGLVLLAVDADHLSG